MNASTNIQPGFPWAYTLLAYGFSWIVWLPSVLASVGIIQVPMSIELFTGLLIMLGAWGPFIAAFTVTEREEGRVGVRQLLACARQWGIGLPAFVMIVGLPVVASLVARTLDTLTGGTPPAFTLPSLMALLPTFLFILLLGGPVQEEFGWRGYALPRLQARWGALGASLILGAVWALWHLPFYAMSGSGMEGTPLPTYILYHLGLAGIMTWLHNRTAGSVFTAILMHTMANFVSNVLPTHNAQVHDSRSYLFLALIYIVVAGVLLLTPALRPVSRAIDARVSAS